MTIRIKNIPEENSELVQKEEERKELLEIKRMKLVKKNQQHSEQKKKKIELTQKNLARKTLNQKKVTNALL